MQKNGISDNESWKKINLYLLKNHNLILEDRLKRIFTDKNAQFINHFIPLMHLIPSHPPPEPINKRCDYRPVHRNAQLIHLVSLQQNHARIVEREGGEFNAKCKEQPGLINSSSSCPSPPLPSFWVGSQFLV